MKNQKKIISLLHETNRRGIDDLVKYLIRDGFFVSPASRAHLGCFTGGLAAHSLRAHELLMFHSGLKLGDIISRGQKPLPITMANLVVAPLLHDVCKMGRYTKTKKGYGLSKKHPGGHAVLSLQRVEKYMELDPLEEMMIRYHMGVYGLLEFDSRYGEYPLCGDSGLSPEARYGKSLRNAWFHNPICKLMYFCDELATMEERADGKRGR